MNKIYYSVRDALSRISEVTKIRPDSGWGRLIDLMEVSLKNYGYTIVDNCEEADLEFYVGQPPVNLYPSMQPNIQLTMYETSLLPRLWSDSINRWDKVIVPSSWGKKTFIESDVNVPVYVIPLPVDVDTFKLIQREQVDKWSYIAQAVQLVDRKNILLVAEIFQEDKMPKDTQLILKTTPIYDRIEINMWMSEQIHFIQESLPIDRYLELFSQCNVSVNPSAAEGFGYICAEHMSTGMCAMMTNYSALTDLLDNNFTIPIDYSISPSYHYMSAGLDAKPRKNDILKGMLWTYENREEAINMGLLSSKMIADKYAPSIIMKQIESLFEEIVTPKKIINYNDEARFDTETLFPNHNIK